MIYARSTLHLSQGMPGSPVPPPLIFLMPWRALSSCLLCSHIWPESSPSFLDVSPDPTPSTNVLSSLTQRVGGAVVWLQTSQSFSGWKRLHKACLALAEPCSDISWEIWSSHVMLWCSRPYRGSPVFLRNVCPGVCPEKSWLLSPTLRHGSGRQMWWLPPQDVQTMTRHETKFWEEHSMEKKYT